MRNEPINLVEPSVLRLRKKGRVRCALLHVFEAHLRQLDAVEFSLRLGLDMINIVAPQQGGDGRRRGDLAVPRQERGVHALTE